MVLTEEQLAMLRKRAPEFRAADQEGRSNIVTACVDRIKGTWARSVPFKRDLVETVCGPYNVSSLLMYCSMFGDT
jgi:hypothetical protein